MSKRMLHLRNTPKLKPSKYNPPLFKPLFLVLLCLFSCTSGQLGRRQSNEFRNGMVVSAYPDASEAGISILKKGGNAVDAAIAVQFALAVTLPEAGNIGGGGFMVYRSAKGETATLDYREKAPAKASRDMFLDSAGNVITDKSLHSHFASGVPGSVDGMVEAHKKYGKLPWAELLKPAIRLARSGFKISHRLADDLNKNQVPFDSLNPGKTYFTYKKLWVEGDKLVQNELAKTLDEISTKGRDGFYSGWVADSIEAEMKRKGGLISKTDLKNYHAVWRKPITGKYKDYTVITMPPPSSGGIALLQLLQSVEKYPLKRWGHNADSTVQLITEAERRVYADRAKYLGDPDFFKVPVDSLLKPAYQQQRMRNFTWAKATPSTSIQAGKIVGYESNETTHFSVVDREGNAVSITTTLNGSFGSKIFVGGCGFLLNNEMDDFSIKPGTPNMFGLIGGKANAIEPNKRMLSSMTPAILEKDGKLFMVVGTPGGSTIITTVFQTILNVTDFGMNMQQAVTAKRFHHQWLPDMITTENGAIDSTAAENLRQKGYVFNPINSIGRTDAILVTQWGYYEGGADPRGDDTAVGY